jgi:integrase
VGQKKLIVMPITTPSAAAQTDHGGAPEDAKPGASDRARQSVPAVQDVIDALPPGFYCITGSVPGLCVRKGTRAVAYYLQRRIAGRLVRKRLVSDRLSAAVREAMGVWKTLKPKPPGAVEQVPTLEQALKTYLTEKRLRPTTAHDYGAFLHRYVADWLPRRLDSIGMDRPGYRARLVKVEKENGPATAGYLHRVIRAIYNHFIKIYPDMPPNPAAVYQPPRIRPRDWALSDSELATWWARVRELDPVKRCAYLTLLFSGARASSALGLKWDDVDFERRVLHFRVSKTTPYSIPMPQKLAGILLEYREKYWLPNEENLVFCSPRKKNAPLHFQLKTPGIRPAHSLRHTMRTRLAEAGATPDLGRVALGHAMNQDISQRYITPHLLVEAVRPFMEAVAARYCAVMGLEGL